MASQQAIKMIEANQIKFAYYEMGSGPLVICLHGFPDTADTWLPLMKNLSSSGYRVVAPFMRGYHPTSVSVNHSYNLRDLGRDVLALIHAFGEQQAGVIGHNWGALAAYAAAVLNPDTVRVIIATSMPHPSVFGSGRGGFLRKPQSFMTFPQRDNPSWIQNNNFRNLATIYKRWSPKWRFDDDILEPIKTCLSQPGSLDAALAYYQAYETDRKNKDVQRIIRAIIGVDTLAIFGDKDGIVDLDTVERTADAFGDNYEYTILPGVGHFPQREAPEEFNRKVVNFLHQKIPPATRPMRDG